MLRITAVAAFKDNYIWLLHRNDGREAVVVDPGDARPVLETLRHNGLELGGILVTHHHWDHTNGIGGLLAHAQVPVWGPAWESQPIPGISNPLREGDSARVECLDAEFAVMAIPGHTLGHIALHGHGLLFCGDTLFSAGCGRLFEGSPAQMHGSLSRLADLPADTRVYCGHEYTEANLAFALAVEPDNQAAADHLARVRTLRSEGQPSLPSTIGLEQQINPFLRCETATVKAAAATHAGHAPASPVECFAALRGWKDHFTAPPGHP
jgi:hydroxyacylglutathione hydrolase